MSNSDALESDLTELAKDYVSVVMPVRNAGKYLQAAVMSVLEQTHQRFELLLIDDSSDDQAIESLLSTVDDPRLRVLQSSGSGIVDALNQGIEQAQYEIIARMDADDICHPQRLSTQLAYRQLNPDVSFIGTTVNLFKNEGEVENGYRIYQSWINNLVDHDDIARQFFIESPMPHPTAMFNRSDFNKLGGYRNSSWPEDYDLWCRALLADKKFGKPATEPMLHWRDHGARTSRVEQRYSKREFLKCKSHYLAKYLKTKLNVTQIFIWGAGPTGVKLHDYLDEAGIRNLGFIDVNPVLLGKRKKGLPITIITSSSDSQTRALKSTLNNTFCVVAVGSRGAREKIREFLSDLGLEEGINFVFAA